MYKMYTKHEWIFCWELSIVLGFIFLWRENMYIETLRKENI